MPLFFRIPIHAYTRIRNDVHDGKMTNSSKIFRVDGLLCATAHASG
ncbi:Uncharacterised protein [Klebsiella pneumoniae]|nr:Uncharacterised protein [Klebsiella pneumoniae]